MSSITPSETRETGAPDADAAGSREIVSFRLAEQDFCIDIMDIREIRGWTPPTPPPATSSSSPWSTPS